ncbi:predicted protein [Postia placenta Mad-698-R]|nr:predicted protein [Postia placenta Mad-698-R]
MPNDETSTYFGVRRASYCYRGSFHFDVKTLTYMRQSRTWTPIRPAAYMVHYKGVMTAENDSTSLLTFVVRHCLNCFILPRVSVLFNNPSKHSTYTSAAVSDVSDRTTFSESLFSEASDSSSSSESEGPITPEVHPVEVATSVPSIALEPMSIKGLPERDLQLDLTASDAVGSAGSCPRCSIPSNALRTRLDTCYICVRDCSKHVDVLVASPIPCIILFNVRGGQFVRLASDHFANQLTGMATAGDDERFNVGRDPILELPYIQCLHWLCFNVAALAEDPATVEEPATTPPDDQHSRSDAPYSASDGNRPAEEPPASSLGCEGVEEDAHDDQAASGGSGREVEAAGHGQVPEPYTEATAPPEAVGGTAPAQQTEQEVKPTTDAKGREDEKTEDPWSLCAEEVWKFEENQVGKWKENINGLLLFAGLFSTILSAFLAAFYLLLGPQTPDTTAQLLVVMSVQLSVLTAAIAHQNLTKEQQTILDAAIATTAPTTTTISTGVLWFIALIFSLSAASISIAVGQWLHHHTDRASSLSRQSVRIWSLRRRGLQKWHVQAIIDILPILLQISLALFLVGLLNLVWHLNYIVAGTSTIIVTALLLPTLLTVLMPYFYADCPYKSRSAWWCFVALNESTHSHCTAWVVNCWETLGVSITEALFATTKRVRSLRGFPAATRNILSELCRLRPAAIITPIANGIKCLARSLWDYTCKFPFATMSNFLILLKIVTHRLTIIRYRCASWMRRYCRSREAWSKWHSDTLGARNWREFENMLVRADNTPEKDKLMLLAEADEMIMDGAFLVNVVHPCFQNGSFESALPALLRILRHRAHEVTLGKDSWHNGRTVLKWLTSEQDSAAIIALADLCVDVIEKYNHPYRRNDDHLVDHLLQLLRAMPLIDSARTVCDRARDLIQWAAEHQDDLRQARIEELDDGADAWLRAADKDYSLEPFYNMLRKRVEASSTVINLMTPAVGHRALDVLDKALLESREASTEHQLLILDAVEKTCEVGPNATSVYSRLPRLLPDLALSQEALEDLVSIIWGFDREIRLDIEDTRRLLTFLPHARKRLDTERFLRITRSALQHSARLPPDELGRVYNEVRGALDVIVEYFSSSGIEEVARAGSWWQFSILLDVCVELAQVDTARPARNGPLVTRDVVNALERCASRCPEDEWRKTYMRDAIRTINSIMGYSPGSPDMTFGIPNEHIAGESVNPAPAPRDVNEAPTEDSQVVDGTPMH